MSNLKLLTEDINYYIENNCDELDHIKSPIGLLNNLIELNELIGLDKIKDDVACKIKNMLENNIKPNNIIIGSPGISKTKVGTILETINNNIDEETINNNIDEETINNKIDGETINNNIDEETINNKIDGETINNNIDGETINNKMFNSRNEFYKKYQQLRGSIITVEGLIGTGKSTSCDSIADFLCNVGINARYFPEYRNDELLSQYINDMNKHAYGFQLFMLGKRAEIYRCAEEYSKTGGISIVDRSIIGDYAFAKMQYMNKKITDEDWKVYNSVLKSENLPEPTFTVYLKCTPVISLLRTKRRCIKSESAYTLQYFKDLEESYKKALAHINHELITIDWSDEREVNKDNKISDTDCMIILDLLLK